MSFPDDLDERTALEMLYQSCDRLRFDMGGTEVSKNCTGLIDKWDKGHPTVFYLERNMRWAKEVLDRKK